MKKVLFLHIFMASVMLLLSCASTPPEWVKNLPQAPDGTNYNYTIGIASGNTREEATERSKVDAYKKASTLRGGVDIRKTAGVKYGVRCEYVVKKNDYKYDVYVLLKYQIASVASGAKDDYNEPDGLKCETQIIESKNSNNDRAIGDKLGQQKRKIEDLEAVAKEFESTENPKNKKLYWLKGKKLYDEINKLQVDLMNLGAYKDLEPIAKIYSDMHDNCIAHSKTYKLYWNPKIENPCSEIAFSMLSKKIKMEKSQCSNGLNLNFDCSEKCIDSSLGIECSFNPSLAVESCNGERYSMLKIKETITGFEAYNKNMAKENLIENLSKADFFKEWDKQIMEWVPQCTE